MGCPITGARKAGQLQGELMQEARQLVERLSGELGIEIRPVLNVAGCEEADRFLATVWELPPGSSFSDIHLMRVLTETGYVAAAFHEGEMVGASFGFMGFEEGKLVLRSHASGVRLDWRDRAVGKAMKLHQRAWALEHGVTFISWSFDPLLRRNAFFNLRKLGAVGALFVRDMYGPFAVGIYARPVSDCLIIHWEVASPRVAAALHDTEQHVDLKELLNSGATVLVESDEEGNPVMGNEGPGPLLCGIPADILSLRRNNPHLGKAWQEALRLTLEIRLNADYIASDFLREGYYVLTPG